MSNLMWTYRFAQDNQFSMRPVWTFGWNIVAGVTRQLSPAALYN